LATSAHFFPLSVMEDVEDSLGPKAVVEDDIVSMTNYLYEFTDPSLRMQFYTFNTHQSTSSTFFSQLYLLMFLVVICPVAILNMALDIAVDRSSDHFFITRLIISCVCLFSTISCFYAALCLYLKRENAWKLSRWFRGFQKFVSLWFSTQNENKQQTPCSKHRRISLVVQLLISIQVYTITVFIRRSFSLNCPQTTLTNSAGSDIRFILRSLGAGQCYDEEYRGLLLYLNGAMMLLIPMMFYVGFPELPIVYVWCNYLAALVTMIVCSVIMFYGSSSGSYPILAIVFIFLLAFMAIREMHLRNLRVFLTNHRLMDALRETKRLHEKNRESEMKYTLGNVTHDLKSVSLNLFL
jgi:hypothetical protein